MTILTYFLVAQTILATSCVVALMLLLAWFLGNIVPFFGAAVDLLGASVTPWGKPKKGGSAWRKFPGNMWGSSCEKKLSFFSRWWGEILIRKNSSIKN